MILQMLETASSAATSSTDAASSTWGTLLTFVPLVLIFVVFYFLLIRPQKKREKATSAMRNSLQVGDEVVTQGGIVGRVVSIKEDNVIIETGTERSKIRIKRWAIATNQTVHDDSAGEVK